MENSNIDFKNLEQLTKLLSLKKSKKYYAKRLGITVEEVDKFMNELRQQKSGETMTKENFIKGTMESVRTLTFEPNSHKELAIVHNIDLKKFIITNYWSKVQTNGNFTSSVFCKRRLPSDYSEEDFQEFLKSYKSTYKPPRVIKQDLVKETIDVELSISDYHLAKRYVDEVNLNVQKRADKFFGIAEKLITRVARNYNIDTVVFPVSNDFFHTDTYFNETTMGTSQDTIAEYDEEYEKGFNCLVQSIVLLKNLSKKVKVVLVPGNHDRLKGFYLAHALEVYFKGDKDIEFLRSKESEKAIMLGNTFIGYHHGNCKLEQLPLMFATHPECSEIFGTARFREIHTGDKHHYMAKEIKGVRIQQMPSLSGNDRWHKDKMFVHNVRAALILMYDKEKGKIGELEERF